MKHYLMNIVIRKSSNPEKKFDAIIDNKKTIRFGNSNYQDFTQHRNEKRKDNYISRHRKNEDWRDPTTAGFYSRWITWNKPTITESINDTNRKFKNLKISLKK